MSTRDEQPAIGNDGFSLCHGCIARESPLSGLDVKRLEFLNAEIKATCEDVTKKTEGLIGIGEILRDALKQTNDPEQIALIIRIVNALP